MNLALATYYPYHVTDERFFIYAFRLSAQRFSNIASDHQRSRKPRDVITILGLNHRFCPVAETMIKAGFGCKSSHLAPWQRSEHKASANHYHSRPETRF
jgi:hypothetical protein